jgi:hypothetical protein
MVDVKATTTEYKPRRIYTRPAPPCSHCGRTESCAVQGKGPHYGKLVCAACGCFLKWLSRPAEPTLPDGKPSNEGRSGV